MNKKIFIFTTVIVALGSAVYFSGTDLSFLGLRSAILGDDCNSTQLQANKAEYEKSVSDLEIINSYIALNNCEINGALNNIEGGLNNFQITACQRKITLRTNKQTFINGYTACQASINAGPKILSGAVVNDGGATSRTLIEQAEGENTHLNESVYSLSLRAQGESYVRELVYELTLPVVNNDVGIKIIKAELNSTKSGSYACAQTLSPTQTDPTKKVYAITCRAVDGGYQMGVGDDNASFATSLNLSVSTISATGEGTLKFVSGKYSIQKMGGDEKPLTRINGVTSGTLKYVMAYVDTRDLTVNLVAQDNTSSTTIPVRAEFNKLIDSSSVSSDDFVLSDNVSGSNLLCADVADAEGGLRTVCTFDLEPVDPAVAGDIVVNFPAGAAKDKTRGTPKTNAAAQKTIHYVYGAPTIVVGAPCGEGEAYCTGLDNTPQLIARTAVGSIGAGSVVALYANNNCSGVPIQTVSATRDMEKVDLYEKNALSKDEERTYTVKIDNNCSALGTSTKKQATYKYTGETIAMIDRMSCMNGTTIPSTKLSVGPYVANTTDICDPADNVDPKKCNAWQENGTFNPECFPTGQGTLQNPYRICTPEQLQEMDNATTNYDLGNHHFRLGKNLDMTKAANWFGGKGFQPIGRTMHFGFHGSLDGNGFEIKNLNFKNSDQGIGLFGAVGGASYPGFWVSNLKLNSTTIANPGNNSGTLIGLLANCSLISGVESVGINMSGVKTSTGGLIGGTGNAGETKVLYAKTQGAISNNDAANAIGGVIGSTQGQILEVGFVDSAVNITAKAGGIGGIEGSMYGTINVHDAVTRGAIRVKDGSTYVGGAFGYINSCIKIQDVKAIPATSNTKITIEGTGTVGYVGGFVGNAAGCEFVHDSTRYSIQGNTAGTIGGFGGSMATTTVSRSESHGNIGGDSSKGPWGYYIGGFVGFAGGGSFIDNYSTSNIYLSSNGAARYIGGFAGMIGGTTIKRSYATGNVSANHNGDWDYGGFIGYITGNTVGSPFVLTDSFSTGMYNDTVGLYGSAADHFGGFAGFVYRGAMDTFTNNYFANSAVNTCTGKASPDQSTCTLVANASAFNDSTYGVYTRTGNSWDFTNTWKAVSGGLPELR